MVEFGLKSLYSGKVIVIGERWLDSGRVVWFGQKWLLKRKNWFYSGNIFFWQNWLYSDKVVVFGINWLDSGKRGCIRTKLVLLGKE